MTAGVDYTKPAAWVIGTTYAAGDLVSLNGSNYVSLVGSNVGNSPDTSADWTVQPQTASVLSPIFSLLCTTTSTGPTTLRAIGDTSDTVFPTGSFVIGHEYSIYLAELVTAGGATFVGYR